MSSPTQRAVLHPPPQPGVVHAVSVNRVARLLPIRADSVNEIGGHECDVAAGTVMIAAAFSAAYLVASLTLVVASAAARAAVSAIAAAFAAFFLASAALGERCI